jgi:hypothetical protein
VSIKLDKFCHYLINVNWECLELMVDKITQISHCCKASKTHFGHSSQIEIEKIFSIVQILTLFHRFVVFKLKILTNVFFVNKNWPFDLHIDYLKHVHFASVCEVKSNLTNELIREWNMKSF